ncbi:Sec-independent protein translocase subunit TatA [Streptosporangium subroseum]|uniref:Sec-independent protein translocase subunit TatA n=1 Tax=Streptosporangium subroseum TaxID=106412 RepID=UPI003093AFE2|nr:Sec-independent protein translocase subunit TatA [Streptosporangium subroseum]
MADLGFPEVLIILAVLILLFGAKRLPDIARSMGRSLRVFKSEINRPQDDEGAPPTQP